MAGFGAEEGTWKTKGWGPTKKDESLTAMKSYEYGNNMVSNFCQFCEPMECVKDRLVEDESFALNPPKLLQEQVINPHAI